MAEPLPLSCIATIECWERRTPGHERLGKGRPDKLARGVRLIPIAELSRVAPHELMPRMAVWAEQAVNEAIRVCISEDFEPGRVTISLDFEARRPDDTGRHLARPASLAQGVADRRQADDRSNAQAERERERDAIDRQAMLERHDMSDYPTNADVFGVPSNKERR